MDLAKSPAIVISSATSSLLNVSVRVNRDSSPGFEVTNSLIGSGYPAAITIRRPPLVFHPLQERVDRFAPVVRPRVAGSREGVRLIDEQHTIEGAVDNAICLDRGLADVFRDEARAVDLDQLTLAEQAHRAINPCKKAGHGCLAGAGVADEE
jgi:hypothetical protein